MTASLIRVGALWCFAVAASLPAVAADTTAIIDRNSEAARGMLSAEPNYTSREERLKAQPLDWRATSGKPKRVAPTPAAKRKPARASAAGGAPDPKAEEEARRLYPQDWKR